MNKELFWEVVRLGSDIIDDFSCVERNTREEIAYVIKHGADDEQLPWNALSKWEDDSLRALGAIVLDAERCGPMTYAEKWTDALQLTAVQVRVAITLECKARHLPAPCSAYELRLEKERQEAAEKALRKLSDDDLKHIVNRECARREIEERVEK